MKSNGSIFRIILLAHKSIGTYLCIVIVMGWATSANAELPNWQCEGAPVVEHHNLIDLDLDTETQAGQTIDSNFDSGQQGTGRCSCPQNGSFFSYFTATTNLPETNGWIKLNDYLEAKIYIYVYGPGNLQVPFSKRKNAGASTCSERYSTVTNVATGRRGMATFRLTKGIVGEVEFSGVLANLYWQLNDSSGVVDMSYPFAHIHADVRIKALASCTFRAGDTFTIDLGSTEKAALVQGSPPKDYAPKSIDLSLDCINTGSTGAINYMFQSATGSEGNLLLTDLKGLGVGLRDGDDNPIGLGMENSVDVPMAASSTSFYLKPYPTKLPGKAVDSGRYTAKAIVTLSLP
ncbi:fimbrial protein [Pseudomonas sp. NPDC078700]|uniref:fimbrial protein n=1 Tax=Pseudomonas sp. NPDC078700 TaxID=3364424 RepID=UPI0037C50F6E